ncbi:MAG TPA: homoserine kinase [Bacteroidales bacterium]|nr:homoserine kinase [Bacteroidales bacterium]
MSEWVKVFSPATVSNVGPGFDVLGFAIDQPGDELIVRKNNTGKFHLVNETDIDLPLEPEKNVASVAAKAMLQELGSQQGFDIILTRKIYPGSGIGSSAASSVGAIFGVNELLGSPLQRKDMVKFAMEGERIACGSAHADNTAPAMMGGFILVQSYNPLTICPIPSPENMYCTVIHPEIEVKTADARKILKKTVSLRAAITQWGNLAGLVTGLMQNDFKLIASSLKDVIVEPVRSILIPKFNDVQKAAIDAGALGCSISGSGPSIFALSNQKDIAENIARIMQDTFLSINIGSKVFVSKVNPEGVRVIEKGN